VIAPQPQEVVNSEQDITKSDPEKDCDKTETVERVRPKEDDLIQQAPDPD